MTGNKENAMYDFHSPGHVADYLNDTIVRHVELGPVYVQNIHTDSEGSEEYTGDIVDLQLYVKPLPYPKQPGTYAKLKYFDFKPLKIGMCNMLDKNGVPADAAYIARIPARRWKIGLSDIGVRPFPVRMQYDEEWNPWLFSAGSTQGGWLVREPGTCMLLNDYPSYSQAMEYMEPYDRRSCAFTRNFAIDAEGKLYYRWHNEPVGRCHSQPTLYTRYDDLKEVLEEDGY